MTSTSDRGQRSPRDLQGSGNPLRDARDRRLPLIAGPSSMVMFGVTGDLARKKLLPAIYDLPHRGLLPPSFGLVGFGRRDWSDDDFADYVRTSVAEHSRTGFDENVFAQLREIGRASCRGSGEGGVVAGRRRRNISWSWDARQLR